MIAVGCSFVFGLVVGKEVDGGVCRCRFPIYVYFQVDWFRIIKRSRKFILFIAFSDRTST